MDPKGSIDREREIFSGTVRPLQKSDLPQIRPILETWIRHWQTKEVLQDEVQKDLEDMDSSLQGVNGQAYFVAEEEGQILGVIGVQDPPKETLRSFVQTEKPIEFIRIYVDLEHTRGRGIGTALVNKARGFARENGYTEAVFDSGPRYKESGWPFHNKHFGPSVGIVPNYYGPGSDAMVWRQALS